MIFAGVVGDFNHRGERGGFARTERTGHEDQTVVIVEQTPDVLGVGGKKAQLFQRHNPVGNQAVRAGHAVLVEHQRRTEARLADLKTDVHVLAPAELFALFLREKRHVEADHIRIGHHPFGIEAFEQKIFADERGRIRGKMKVGSPVNAEREEQLAHGVRNLFVGHLRDVPQVRNFRAHAVFSGNGPRSGGLRGVRCGSQIRRLAGCRLLLGECNHLFQL